MKPPLLFLCHRIPYPPNKGDKIRSYHLLSYLNQHYRVFLGTFIDEESDWDHVAKVKELCEESCFIELNPRKASVKSLAGFFTGKPLTLHYYFNKRLVNWIRCSVGQHNIDRLIVYSSAMAQYFLNSNLDIKRTIIDFVDVDSDKWRQYAEERSWPMNLIYRREARQLLCFEQKAADVFGASLFVSSSEAEMFRTLCPGASAKVDFYNNGVDTEYFLPNREYPNVYPKGIKAVVFTGSLDYWPNIDAVTWFALEVFPGIRRNWPETQFYIVGSKPSEKVLQLESEPGVVVTGRVDDVRPYLAYAAVAVAPMRIARGIQNKVLEAMAMAKPVVVSSKGLEGISALDNVEVHVADNASSFVAKIGAILSDKEERIGAAARAKVCKDFIWESSLYRVKQLVETLQQEHTTQDIVVSKQGAKVRIG